MREARLLILASVLGLVLVGCPAETAEEEPAPAAAPDSVVETVPIDEAVEEAVAVAELRPAPGGTAAGTVTFTEQEDGRVRIVAEVHGVEAAGEHGLHLHEVGDCSADDFSSAGGHFNPTSADHGGPDAVPHHAGDFGNVAVGEDGTGHLELTSDMLKVTGEPSVVGKAVVLHEGRDDLTSQPTGDSGGRIACGVVERADEADAMLSPAITEPAGDADADGDAGNG